MFVVQFGDDGGQYAGQYVLGGLPTESAADAQKYLTRDTAANAARQLSDGRINGFYRGITFNVVELSDEDTRRRYRLRVKFQGKMRYFNRDELAAEAYLFLGLNHGDVTKVHGCVAMNGTLIVGIRAAVADKLGYAWIWDEDERCYAADVTVTLDDMIRVIVQPEEPVVESGAAAMLGRLLG